MSSFGEELRRERELREISLREIAEATKISLRYLDALERNDFRHLPGGVFNKGFVRAYSQFIGIDPEGMVNAYLLELKSQESRSLEGKGDGGRGGAPGGRVSPREATERRTRFVAPQRLWRGIALLALLIAAAVLLGYAAFRIWRSVGSSTEPTRTSAILAPPSRERAGA